MEELGFSAKSVNKILQNEKWVEIYREHLVDCHSKIIEERSPSNMFSEIILPQLVKNLEIELSKQEVETIIRCNLQKWSLLFAFKYQFLIRLQQLIPDEVKDTERICNYYSGICLGPLDNEIYQKLSTNDRIKWSEGSNIVYFKKTSLKNFIGIFVSEEFFITEAMCRVILIGTCYEFALKSILPNLVIQHDEIYKTLKRLGSNKNDKVACKMCPVNKQCVQREIFLDLANLYCLFYHLRVIKDYKMDFFNNPIFTKFLLEDFFFKSFEITCNFEKIIDKNFSKYWFSSFSLKDDSENIHRIIKKIS